jgi:putative spermidine/putrescine transport system permease protein
MTSAKSRLLAALVTVTCALPFLFMAMLSVARRWRYPDVLPDEWDFGAWSAVGGTAGIGRTFAFSVGLSALVALLSTALAFVTSRFVAYHRHRRKLLIAAYLPYVISPVVLAVCILYLSIRARLDGTVTGVILAQTILTFSFGIIFFVDFWSDEKRALEQLVYTLGGSTLDAYRRVLLPMSRDALLLCFFECFLLSWVQYGLTLLIGGGRVQTLSTRVFDFLFEANVRYAAVSSMLLVLPPLLLLWVHKRVTPRIPSRMP